ARHLARDPRAKALALDGWTALTAYVPPKERRGVVLVDPAFEAADEFARLADRFAAAHRKWPSGTYLLWDPIKDREGPDTLARRLRQLAIAKLLRAELSTGKPREGERLAACGLVVANPPWTLERELVVLLPALAAILGPDGKSATRLDW